MRTTIAAIAGALLATLGLAAVQSRSIGPATSSANGPVAWTGMPAQAQPVALSTSGLSAMAPASGLLGVNPSGAVAGAPAVMRCAPGQQAVVQQAIVDGRAVTTADCVWDTSSALNGVAPYPRTVPAADIVEYQPRAQAVRYVQEEPVRRRVVRTAPRRSWQKTALVIGGSAGAGAGVGALAGGKKGALIGAAIGGGAASLFEAMKRK